MATSFSTARRNAMLDAVRADFNSGFLRIYAGAIPADADAALGGATLLAQLTLNATAFSPAASGVVSANAITRDASADASGTASFFRLYASDASTCLAQGAVAVSGGELNLVSTSIVAGMAIEVSSLTITIAAS